MNWVSLLWWQNGFKCMLFFLLQKASSHLVCKAVICTPPLQGHLSTAWCLVCCVYSLQSFLSGALTVLCIADSWGKSSKCCLRFSNDRQIAISINPLSVFSKEHFDRGVCGTGSTWQDSAPTQIPPLQMEETKTLHHPAQHWCRQHTPGSNLSTGAHGGGQCPASAWRATHELSRLGER